MWKRTPHWNSMWNWPRRKGQSSGVSTATSAPTKSPSSTVATKVPVLSFADSASAHRYEPRTPRPGRQLPTNTHTQPTGDRRPAPPVSERVSPPPSPARGFLRPLMVGVDPQAWNEVVHYLLTTPQTSDSVAQVTQRDRRLMIQPKSWAVVPPAMVLRLLYLLANAHVQVDGLVPCLQPTLLSLLPTLTQKELLSLVVAMQRQDCRWILQGATHHQPQQQDSSQTSQTSLLRQVMSHSSPPSTLSLWLRGSSRVHVRLLMASIITSSEGSWSKTTAWSTRQYLELVLSHHRQFMCNIFWIDALALLTKHSHLSRSKLQTNGTAKAGDGGGPSLLDLPPGSRVQLGGIVVAALVDSHPPLPLQPSSEHSPMKNTESSDLVRPALHQELQTVTAILRYLPWSDLFVSDPNSAASATLLHAGGRSCVRPEEVCSGFMTWYVEQLGVGSSLELPAGPTAALWAEVLLATHNMLRTFTRASIQLLGKEGHEQACKDSRNVGVAVKRWIETCESELKSVLLRGVEIDDQSTAAACQSDETTDDIIDYALATMDDASRRKGGGYLSEFPTLTAIQILRCLARSQDSGLSRSLLHLFLSLVDVASDWSDANLVLFFLQVVGSKTSSLSLPTSQGAQNHDPGGSQKKLSSALGNQLDKVFVRLESEARASTLTADQLFRGLTSVHSIAKSRVYHDPYLAGRVAESFMYASLRYKAHNPTGDNNKEEAEKEEVVLSLEQTALLVDATLGIWNFELTTPPPPRPSSTDGLIAIKSSTSSSAPAAAPLNSIKRADKAKFVLLEDYWGYLKCKHMDKFEAIADDPPEQGATKIKTRGEGETQEEAVEFTSKTARPSVEEVKAMWYLLKVFAEVELIPEGVLSEVKSNIGSRGLLVSPVAHEVAKKKRTTEATRERARAPSLLGGRISVQTPGGFVHS